jgi:archaellum component FlaC
MTSELTEEENTKNRKLIDEYCKCNFELGLQIEKLKAENEELKKTYEKLDYDFNLIWKLHQENQSLKQLEKAVRDKIQQLVAYIKDKEGIDSTFQEKYLLKELQELLEGKK